MRFIDAGWLYHHQFPGRFPVDEVIKWCDNMCQKDGNFTYAGPSFWFTKQEHYTWFLLRWSCTE